MRAPARTRVSTGKNEGKEDASTQGTGSKVKGT
jgi:hypothetical protein